MYIVTKMSTVRRVVTVPALITGVCTIKALKSSQSSWIARIVLVPLLIVGYLKVRISRKVVRYDAQQRQYNDDHPRLLKSYLTERKRVIKEADRLVAEDRIRVPFLFDMMYLYTYDDTEIHMLRTPRSVRFTVLDPSNIRHYGSDGIREADVVETRYTIPFSTKRPVKFSTYVAPNSTISPDGVIKSGNELKDYFRDGLKDGAATRKMELSYIDADMPSEETLRELRFLLERINL